MISSSPSSMSNKLPSFLSVGILLWKIFSSSSDSSKLLKTLLIFFYFFPSSFWSIELSIPNFPGLLYLF